MTKQQLVAAMAPAPDDAEVVVQTVGGPFRLNVGAVCVEDYLPPHHESMHEDRVPNGIVRIVVR